ncbi:MAG: hypothetical protein K6E37_04835 [Bacteroidales bacterium]|nr:hypothetical protein [Bacteroidales bacterium]
MKRLLIAFAAFLALTSCNILDDDKWTPVSIPSSISKQWITYDETTYPGYPVCVWDFTTKKGYLACAYFSSTDALKANPQYVVQEDDFFSIECFKKGKTYRLAIARKQDDSRFVYYFDDITANSITITGHPYDVYDGEITYRNTATLSPVKVQAVFE